VIIEESEKKDEATSIDQATMKTLEMIAKKHADIPTLKERNSDSLDFHDLGVVSIRNMLYAAYQEGIEDATNEIRMNGLPGSRYDR
jgi:hypothetical protein